MAGTKTSKHRGPLGPSLRTTCLLTYMRWTETVLVKSVWTPSDNWRRSNKIRFIFSIKYIMCTYSLLCGYNSPIWSSVMFKKRTVYGLDYCHAEFQVQSNSIGQGYHLKSSGVSVLPTTSVYINWMRASRILYTNAQIFYTWLHTTNKCK